jgi:hypothetical protein
MEREHGGCVLRASAGAREGHGYQRPVHWSAGKRNFVVEGNCTPDHRRQLHPFHTGRLSERAWRPFRRLLVSIGAIQVLIEIQCKTLRTMRTIIRNVSAAQSQRTSREVPQVFDHTCIDPIGYLRTAGLLGAARLPHVRRSLASNATRTILTPRVIEHRDSTR